MEVFLIGSIHPIKSIEPFYTIIFDIEPFFTNNITKNSKKIINILKKEYK